MHKLTIKHIIYDQPGGGGRGGWLGGREGGGGEESIITGMEKGKEVDKGEPEERNRMRKEMHLFFFHDDSFQSLWSSESWSKIHKARTHVKIIRFTHFFFLS